MSPGGGTIVEERGVAVGGNEDIVRIDVAVTDAVRVQVLQRARHAQRHARDKAGAEGAAGRPAAAQQRLQVRLASQGLALHPPQHQRMRLLQLCQHPAQPTSHVIIVFSILIYILRLFLPETSCTAATKTTLVGLARSKQDPINRGHGAQYLCRPLPSGAYVISQLNAGKVLAMYVQWVVACLNLIRKAGTEAGALKSTTDFTNWRFYRNVLK